MAYSTRISSPPASVGGILHKIVKTIFKFIRVADGSESVFYELRSSPVCLKDDRAGMSSLDCSMDGSVVGSVADDDV